MIRPDGTDMNVSEMSASLWTPGWGRGGNVPIVLQRRFSNVIVCDTEISPTLEAGAGGVATTCR